MVPTASSLASPPPAYVHRINLTEMMGYPLMLHVHRLSSPTPLQWQSWSGEELLADGEFLFDPGLGLERIFSDEEINSIEPSIKALAFAVPHLKYAVLQAVLTLEEAKELANSNKLLFLLLIDYALQIHMCQTEFQRLVRSKRTDILQAIGLIKSASLVKILSRTPIGHLYNFELDKIKQALSQPDLISKLRHVKKPTPAAFMLLNGHFPLFWPGLFNMLRPEDNYGRILHIKRLVRDTLRMGATHATIKRLQHSDELEALHDQYVTRFNRQHNQNLVLDCKRMYGDFPTPPIAGTDKIIPLKSWQELIDEGQSMRHCVGSYHNSVAERKCFIYKVLGNKRLTLSLRHRGQSWVVDELRGKANSQASPEDYDLVYKWLNL